MINVQNLDKGTNSSTTELELLKNDAEKVRDFYALTGPARKDYGIQMAEAEAERIRIMRQAQADGLLAIRKAEAEGYKLIGEALAQIESPEAIVQLAGLMALQQVAQSLGDGKATKLFLPQNLGNIFSLIGTWQNALDTANGVDTEDIPDNDETQGVYK